MIERRPPLTRRGLLTGVGVAGAFGLAGCMERLAARADQDLPIRTVAVESDEDGGFYHPTQPNIESGRYSPLTRPLYIFVSHSNLQEKPDLLGAYLEHYFEHQRDLAPEVGYYATAEAVPRENAERLRTVREDLGLTPQATATDLAGEIVCSGSNTVAPITRAAGEDFERIHDDVLVAVEPEGTGAGFAEFVKGNTDVQSASRDILPDEAAEAERNGITYSRYEIGWDGLAVVVHADNDWLEAVTLEELRRTWDYASDVDAWNDLRPEFPAETISLWGRDSGSGTFDYFTETINGDVGRIRTDYSPHTDTGSIMAGVAHSRFTFGWGGVGYYTRLKEEPFAHV